MYALSAPSCSERPLALAHFDAGGAGGVCSFGSGLVPPSADVARCGSLICLACAAISMTSSTGRMIDISVFCIS